MEVPIVRGPILGGFQKKDFSILGGNDHMGRIFLAFCKGSSEKLQFGGFLKLGVPFFGVPIERPMLLWGLYWGLYWGPLI